MEKTEQPELVVLCASLSVDSNTRHLCVYAAAHAELKGMKVTYIDLKDHKILPYGEEGGLGVEYLKQRLGYATGIVVGFPLYNYTMNASLKAVIEHCGSCFEDKVVGLMTAAGGRSSYMSVMNVAQCLMLDFRSWVVPRCVYAAREEFNAEGIEAAEVKQRIEELVETVHRTAWQHSLALPNSPQ
jgi:NAD(P)H-dependent FMN reductase